MALDTTSLTAEVIYNPFTGITARARANSAVPRAEVYAVVNEGTWPATGAGDQRRLRIIHTLDTNYAYVIVGAYLKASGSAFVNADACAEMVITASSSVYYSTALENFDSKISDNGTTQIGAVTAERWLNSGYVENIRLLQLREVPAGLIFPFNDTNSIPSINISWYDPTGNQAAATINYNLRLLQFDVDQAYDYIVNQPSLIR